MFAGLRAFGYLACHFVYNPEFCAIALKNLVRPMLNLGLNRIFNDTVICKRTGFCRYPIYIRDDDRAYTYRVLKDKPPKKHIEVNPNGDTFKFVAFTDIHVDLYYEEGSEALCDISICCRKESANKGNKAEPTLRAGKWGTLAKCDLPLVIDISNQ